MDIKARVSVRPSSNDLWFLAYLPLAITDGIATPLIPLLALEHFGASAFAVTIIIGASAMSQVPFTILWGNLSDRVAHRKFFLVGSFLATGVAIILIALAHDLITYFWLNVAEGLASAASAPIGTMLLLETRHKRWWPQDIGLFGLISGLGTTVGLGLGFVWLFVIGGNQTVISAMTALLILAGALAILSAFIAAAWIEEPLARVERRSVAELINLHRGVLERVRHYRSRVLNIVELTRAPAERLPRREIVFLAALGVMTVGFDVFYGPFPVFLAETLQFRNSDVFIVYLAASAASTALFFHSGKLVEWASPKFVFLQSLAGRAVLMLLFLWGPIYIAFGLGSPYLVGWISILNALLGVTWAFISTASTMFLIRLVGRTSRGRALGLYNAVAGAGGLFGTLLGGYLFVTYGWHFAYLIGSIAVVVGMGMLAPIPYHMFTLPRPAGRHRHWRSVRALAFRPPRRR
ncbi:MAG: MFS transporter [Thermoplasmata archaeon]|nr:MFS transporter [Thermoplasmata archaeon]MCI4333731.1 MFS transporter [Thermoplasmata archaeon]